jgi:hypothetical protein
MGAVHLQLLRTSELNNRNRHQLGSELNNRKRHRHQLGNELNNRKRQRYYLVSAPDGMEYRQYISIWNSMHVIFGSLYLAILSFNTQSIEIDLIPYRGL